jgi:hypothetical protein
VRSSVKKIQDPKNTEATLRSNTTTNNTVRFLLSTEGSQHRVRSKSTRPYDHFYFVGSVFLHVMAASTVLGCDQDQNHACDSTPTRETEKGDGDMFNFGENQIEICSAPAHSCVFAASGPPSSCEQVCREAEGFRCFAAWDDLNDDALGSKVCECGRNFVEPMATAFQK